MTKNDLTQGSVYIVLMRFALPFLLSNLFLALYGAVDLLIIGYFSDAAGISAVANGGQIMHTIICFVTGISTGGTVIIGHYAGAKNQHEIVEMAETMLLVAIAVSLVLTLLTASTASIATSLMQVPEEAIPGTISYITICSIGILFIFLYDVAAAVFRGIGDSKSPLIIIGIACILNIVLDLVFVGTLGYGVKGAAIATVIAEGVCGFWAISFLKRQGLIRKGKDWVKIRKAKIRRLFVIGFPISMQDTLVMLSFLIITVAINRLGLSASAALGISEKINGFTLLPPSAISGAVAAMTAQNMGALLTKRATDAMRIGVTLSLIFGIPAFLLLQISPELLAAAFTSDPDVINDAALYLRGFSFDCVFVCLVFCMNGFFNGCGNTTYTMINNLTATFFLRIPVTFIFSMQQNANLFKIGLAAPIASLFSIVLNIYFYRSKRWEKPTNNLSVNR